jgi:hypothetical protein
MDEIDGCAVGRKQERQELVAPVGCPVARYLVPARKLLWDCDGTVAEPFLAIMCWRWPITVEFFLACVFAWRCSRGTREPRPKTAKVQGQLTQWGFRTPHPGTFSTVSGQPWKVGPNHTQFHKQKSNQGQLPLGRPGSGTVLPAGCPAAALQLDANLNSSSNRS